MIRIAFILSLVPTCVLGAVIYIDRFTLDCNKQLGNWSTEFTHNENRNAIVNVTIRITKPLTKMLVYFKVNMAENDQDREFKREFLRTVFNGEKTAIGAKKNFLVAAFVENLKRFMQFEVRFPFQPVSFAIFVNFLIENFSTSPKGSLPNRQFQLWRRLLASVTKHQGFPRISIRRKIRRH